MRRLLAFIVATCGVLVLSVPWTVLWPLETAWAQDVPAVRLTLLSQTPWNSSFEGGNGRLLLLRFRAENLSDAPIDDLSIGVTLYGRLISRTAFEQSLTADAGIALQAETVPREGRLEPGATRDFEVELPLDSPGISTTESGVYPLKIDLRSGFTSLVALRTPVIFLVRRPELPLSLSWTFVLDHPIGFDPAGVFTSADLEVALKPGGTVASQIRSLRELVRGDSPTAVDVEVSPMLLGQLERMRDGYRILRKGKETVVGGDAEGAVAAAQALLDLRSIARGDTVRVSALPFSMPELPSLVAAGLDRDVPLQLQRGDDEVRTALEITPISGVLRPPGAALDETSLRELTAAGVSTLVVGPSTVAPLSQDPLGFAGPPTAALDGGALDAIVPDPAVMTLLGSELVRNDPVLGAQAMLGELATIWQEQPGVARGVALVLSEDLAAPGAFYAPFARGVAGAPWIRTMHAAEFVGAFPPQEAPPLVAPATRRFAPSYVEQLRQARRRVETLRSMLVRPSDGPDRFDTLLLLAESRQFLSNPSDGLAFIAAVRDAVGAVFDGITVETPDVITLTSSTGSSVPVRVSNDSNEALRVRVALVSQHLRDPPTTELELVPGGSQLVTFAVNVRSTGRFKVELRVVAPGGRILEKTSFVVRSTVYNRIALFITIAAAVVLLGLWVRRLLPRRTS